MSAFVLAEKHINTILTYANRHMQGGINLPSGKEFKWDNSDHLQAMAQILINENVKSVNYLYSDNSEPDTITFHFEPFNKDTSPVQIIKACQSYDYQACETDNYRDSDAAMIINWIRDTAISNLPGYESAEWSID